MDYFLMKLAQKEIKVFMVSGNHDSDDRLNYGSTLFASNQIFISAVFDGTLHRQSFAEEDTKINIYMLPFVKASQVRHYFPDEKIESYDDAVQTIIRNTDINKGNKNILVAHQFVSGKGEDPALAGSESVGTQSVGLVEKSDMTALMILTMWRWVISTLRRRLEEKRSDMQVRLSNIR